MLHLIPYFLQHVLDCMSLLCVLIAECAYLYFIANVSHFVITISSFYDLSVKACKPPRCSHYSSLCAQQLDGDWHTVCAH